MATKRPTTTQLLSEALGHLDALTKLALEWQTDWSAISPQLANGHDNPDFDEDYVSMLRDRPEDVFDPAVLAAREFLNRVRTK